MHLHAFDPTAGYYHFSVTSLRAAAHRHPLTEILLVPGDTPFQISLDAGPFTPSHCTCVLAQQTHAVSYAGAEPLHIILLEHPEYELDVDQLAARLKTIQGARPQVQIEVKRAVEGALRAAPGASSWDERAGRCRDFMNANAAGLILPP